MAESLMYCQTAGECALLNGGVCTGILRVKGSGYGSRDLYGEQYDRRCSKGGSDRKIRVSTVPGEVKLLGCGGELAVMPVGR